MLLTLVYLNFAHLAPSQTSNSSPPTAPENAIVCDSVTPLESVNQSLPLGAATRPKGLLVATKPRPALKQVIVPVGVIRQIALPVSEVPPSVYQTLPSAPGTMPHGP